MLKKEVYVSYGIAFSEEQIKAIKETVKILNTLNREDKNQDFFRHISPTDGYNDISDIAYFIETLLDFADPKYR